MPETPFLPYGRQWIDDSDLDAVAEVLRSDFLTTGPWVERFETSMKKATGTAHAAVLNSGTSALHAAYAAVGLGSGKTLLTSPLTFAATANAARYLGADVRFADVDSTTGNLDPNCVAAALATGPVDLLVAVDFAGQPADYDALRPLADARGIPLISDAAHSLGASLHGRPVGTLADLTALSLHPVKPVTSAEGGAVVGQSRDLVDRVRRFRSHGIVRESAELRRPDGPWSYEMVGLGFNYRLTDLQCALGWSQMHRLQGFLARRRWIAQRYLEAFADLPQLRCPVEPPGVVSGWHLFVVRVQGEAARRRPFFEALRAEGLGVQVHYLPVYRHPYYEDLGFRQGLCPVAEDFYARAVTLPLFPKMSDADVDRVIEVVHRVAKAVL